MASNQNMADIPETIQARQFQLVDSEGRVRAVLGMSAEGDAQVEQPSLQLLRSDGTPALRLFLHSFRGFECAQIKLYDKEQKERLSLGISDEEPQYPGMSMTDSEGEERLGLVVTPNDDVEICITNHNQMPVWMARS